MLPVSVNEEYLNKILPYTKVFNAFLKPKQNIDVYNVLINQYTRTHGYNLIMNQGLIASGI